MIFNFKKVPPAAFEAKRIAEERISEVEFGGTLIPDEIELSFAEQPGEGFILNIINEKVDISAGKTREFIAGVGRLLTILRKTADEGGEIADVSIRDIPKFPMRVHYMPGHFGNPFEVAWPLEMQRFLEDLALAGASGYGDWFDTNDMPDPYGSRVFCSASMSLWKKKKEFLKISKRLGLENKLIITTNVAFTDQLRPEWEGTRSDIHRVQGQVLCPSIPEARQVCLTNQENLFRDLSESGVVVDKVSFAPYDDGGCACDKCQPYYPIFLSMVMEIFTIIRKYYPGIKADIAGWWASDDELGQIREFVGNVAKDWFETFEFSATYDVFSIPEDIRSSIGDMPLSTFFHIGFSNDDRDVYMKMGIHSAPARIRSVIGSFEKVGCLGFNTYNESFGDHLNEYLCSRLGRDPNADTRELVTDYCRQVYSLRGQNLRRMVDVLLEMQFLEEEKAGIWLTALEEIRPYVKIPPHQAWAFEHVILKAELMDLDHKIGSGAGWRNEKDIAPVLPLIKKRLELSEKLWREVYGMGVLRHCFIVEQMMPEWYGKYITLQTR